MAVTQKTVKIYHRLVEALGGHVVHPPTSVELAQDALVLDLKHPLPARLRFYAYAARYTDAERQGRVYKSQLTRGLVNPAVQAFRLRFDRTNGAAPVVVGYAEAWDVFIMWDAAVHDRGDGFPYSKMVAVPDRVVRQALTKDWVEHTRAPYGSGRSIEETVIVTKASRLVPALGHRVRLSREALLRR